MTAFDPDSIAYEGTFCGVICGRRGPVRIGHAGRTLHVVVDGSHAFAPSLWAIAVKAGASVKSDGRLTWHEGYDGPDATALVDAIDAWIARGTPIGGIEAGDRPLYRVRRVDDAWAYRVTALAPAGRPSIKRLGSMVSADTAVVPFERAPDLGALLDKTTDAAEAQASTTIQLPEVAGVTVTHGDGVIRLQLERVPQDVYDVLRRTRTARWDPGTRSLTVQARYRKSLAKAMDKALGLVVAQAVEQHARDEALGEAAKAAAAADAEAPLSTAVVKASVANGAYRLAFGYHARAVGAVKRLAGARWDAKAKQWSVPATVGVDAVRTAIFRITEILTEAEAERAAEKVAREAAKADEAAQRAEARQWRALVMLAWGHRVGDVIRFGSALGRITEFGKQFRIDEDMPSIWGHRFLGHEGERGCYAYGRALTDEELADYEAAAAAEEDRRRRRAEATRRIRELEAWAEKTGEYPQGDHHVFGDPARQVLDTFNIYGGGEVWVILDDVIWFVRNNGMDGDNWGRNNVRTGGAGAIGHRLPFDQVLVDELLALQQTVQETGGWSSTI